MFPLGNLVIKDKFIRRWAHKEGFSGFKRYVTAAEDKELEAKIAVVEKYNIRIPELVARIERCHIEDLDFAGEDVGRGRPLGLLPAWTSLSGATTPTRGAGLPSSRPPLFLLYFQQEEGALEPQLCHRVSLGKPLPSPGPLSPRVQAVGGRWQP